MNSNYKFSIFGKPNLSLNFEIKNFQYLAGQILNFQCLAGQISNFQDFERCKIFILFERCKPNLEFPNLKLSLFSRPNLEFLISLASQILSQVVNWRLWEMARYSYCFRTWDFFTPREEIETWRKCKKFQMARFQSNLVKIFLIRHLPPYV